MKIVMMIVLALQLWTLDYQVEGPSSAFGTRSHYLSRESCEVSAERRLAQDNPEAIPSWGRGSDYSETFLFWSRPWTVSVGIAGGFSGVYSLKVTVRCVREVNA